MKIRNQAFALTAVAAATLLAACGGSGNDPAANQSPTVSDVLSSGVITDFGSVWVNGVRYDTSNARIYFADDDSGNFLIEGTNDPAALQAYLGLGQVVTVVGSSNDDGSNGVADAVYFDSEVVGPVDTGSISNANGTFVVLGQTIAVTPDTVIDDSIIEDVTGQTLTDDLRFGDIELTTGQLITLEALLANVNVLEINGFPTATGLEATRIEDVNNRDRSNGNRSANSNEAELKGFVRDLDDQALTFKINGLTVNYTTEALDDDFGGVLQNGQFVEVKVSGTPTPSSTNIQALEIELEDDFRGNGPGSDSSDNGRVEIEGIITEVRADDSGTGGVIVIDGVEIRVDNISLFSEGLRIEVKGRFSGATLEISQIKDDTDDSIRVEVQSVGPIDGDVIATELGMDITITDRTRVEDRGEGTRIEARGFPLNGNIVWTRVEFDDAESDCRLRGPVAEITGTSAADFGLVIEGVTVDLSQLGSFGDFQNSNDIGIGRDAFFNQLAVGDEVQAQSIDGGCTVGNLVADQVEFQSSSSSSSSSDDGASSSSDDGASSSSDDGASSSSDDGASSSSDDGASSSSDDGASSSSDDGASSSSDDGASSSSDNGASSSSDDGSSSSAASSSSASSSSSSASSSSSSAGSSSSGV